MKIYKGSNAPIALAFKEDVSTYPYWTIILRHVGGTVMKTWSQDDISWKSETVEEVTKYYAILPLKQSETFEFLCGLGTLEITGKDTDELIRIYENVSVTVKNRVRDAVMGADNAFAEKVDTEAEPVEDIGTVIVVDIESVKERVSAIESKESTWDAKAEKSDIPTAEIEANTAARHTHNNKTILDGITTDKISAWNGKVGYAEYSDDYLYLYNDTSKSIEVAKLLIDAGLTEAQIRKIIESYGYAATASLSVYAKSADLATVAKSGSYNDLSNKPTIPEAYDDTEIKKSLSDETTARETAESAIKSDLADINLLSSKRYEQVNGIISGTIWILKTSSAYKHIAIPVMANDTIKITCSANGSSYIAGLKSYSGTDSAPVFSENSPFTAVLKITANKEYTYTIPSDVTYLIVVALYNNVEVFPYSFSINGYDISESARENITNRVLKKDYSETVSDMKKNISDDESINNKDFFYSTILREDKVNGGITYTWADKVLSMVGTASNSYLNLFKYQDGIPNGVTDGNWYYFYLNCSNSNIYVNFYFYVDGVEQSHVFKNTSGSIYIPEGTDGLLVRVVIVGGEINDTLECKLLTFKPVTENDKYDINGPKIITFKDDDTENNTAIGRYHDACLHNGIYGNFLTIAQKIEQGYTSAETLANYEQEGFNVLTHCYRQGENEYWTTQDTAQRREDLVKCIKLFRTYGFINPFVFWQYPGGHTDDDAVTMCKDFGFGALGANSVDESIAVNAIDELDRYHIKTFSMREADDIEGHEEQSLANAKLAIDHLADSNGGLLILTTHFAQWTGNTWDETLDDNGYPIGYSRFNELVEYAKASGCKIETIANALVDLNKYFIN